MISTTPTSSFQTAWTLLSLAAAIALLVSFIWVVSDFTELGLQRQEQQRATGVWMPDDGSTEPLKATVPVQNAQDPEVVAGL